MKRLSEFFKMTGRKALAVFFDGRAGLCLGTLLLTHSYLSLSTQDYVFAYLQFVLGAFLVCYCCIGIGEKSLDDYWGA